MLSRALVFFSSASITKIKPAMLANLLLLTISRFSRLNETKITVVLHLNLAQVGVLFASISAYNVLGASKEKQILI